MNLDDIVEVAINQVSLNQLLYFCIWNGTKYPYDEVNSTIYIVRYHKAYFNKVKRVRDRFVYASARSKNFAFITLTFDDKHIKYTKNQHSRIIKNALGFSKFYFYNIDFGKKNGRLHYHAIIFLDSDIPSELKWPYGFYNIKPITFINDCLFRYIIKYSYHSMSNQRMYYSFKGYDKFSDCVYRNQLKEYDIYKLKFGLEFD